MEFIYVIPAIVNIASSFLMSLLTYFKRPDLKHYILFNLNHIIWSSLYILQITYNDRASVLFISNYVMTFVIIIPYLFINFCYEITQVKYQKIIKIYNNIAAFTLVYLTLFTNFMIESVRAINVFDFWPKAGPGLVFVVLYFFVNITIGHYILFKKYSLDNKVIYIFIATLIGFAGGVTNFIPYWEINLPPFGNILLSAYILLMGYAIIKKRLIDVAVVISRTVSSLVLVIFYSVNIIAFNVLYFDFLGNEAGMLFFIGNAAVVIAVGLSYEKSRLWLQTTTDKLFLKGKYDYSKVVLNFTEKFSKCSSITDLNSILRSGLINEIEVSSIIIFLPENFEGYKEEIDAYESWTYEQDEAEKNYSFKSGKIKISSKSEVVLFLQSEKNILSKNYENSKVQKVLKELAAEVVIPSFIDGHLASFISIGKKMSEGKFTENDYNLFAIIATQVSTVIRRIENTRKAAEVGVAQKIQMEILPQNPSVPSMEIATFMSPADDVGGDFFDIHTLEEHAWIFVGDVTGHGLASGLVMFMVQSIISAILQTKKNVSPKELNYIANRILYQNLERLDEKRQMTIASIRIDHGNKITLSGSHDNIFLYKKKLDEVITISLDHFPMGLGFVGELSLEEMKENKFNFESNDILFIGTDGITEAFKDGVPTKVQFGDDKLIMLIKKNSEKSAEKIKMTLLQELEQFTSGTYYDDVTFVIAKSS